MKVVVTERKGANAIWGVMNPVASALLARGDEMIYCRFDDGQQREPLPPPTGVDIVDVKVPAKKRPWDLYRQHQVYSKDFSALLTDLKPEIVHTHFCVPGISARLVAKRLNVPALVSTQHELYQSMNLLLRLGVRFTDRCADSITYVSKTVEESFGHSLSSLRVSSNSRFPNKVVIHNGVDVRVLELIRKRIKAKKTFQIASVGRMVSIKGQETLIKAMPTVLSRFPEARLVVVGSGPNEVMIRNLVDKLGLNAKVDFTGWIDRNEALEIIAGSAILVAASDEEGFGLAVAEGMALGTSVVASHIPAFEEILGGNDECGYFFENRNAEYLSRMICKVFENPDESVQRAINGLLRVQEKFSVAKMVNGYLDVYDSLAK